MTKKTNNSGEMSFLEHLEELRWHLVRSVIAVLAFAILAFIFNEFIIDHILFAPKNPDFFIFYYIYKKKSISFLYIYIKKLLTDSF